MATLIQSKQIQGVVTASVIQGDFQVDSGSVNLTGASGVSGSFSGSFLGDGSQLTFGGTNLVSGSSQVSISQTDGYTAFSSSIATSISSIVDSDSQTLSISGDQLSISNGNTVTIPTGSGGGGTSDFTQLTNVPSGLISSSTQLPSGIISGSSQLPSGLVSSSVQITDGSGILSGSIVDQLPSGIISGSTFTNFSASVDSRIVGISASGSGADWNTNLQNIPSGLVSSSSQITDGSGIVSGSVLRTLDGTGVLSGSIVNQLPSGVISGSSQLPSGLISSSTQITDGSGIVSGSVVTTLDGTGVVSGSVVRTLDGTGVFSGSLVAGTNVTINQDGNNFIISSSASGGGSVPAGTISGSAQITALGFTSGSHTDIPSGTISSSAQVISSLPSGVISGSSQLPSGTISGSSQITDGSGIFSGSLVAGTNVTINQDGNNFIISSSASGGGSTPAGTISSSAQVVDSLPSGVISGSTQITDGSGIVSGSVLRTLDGTGVFSGSLVAGSNITINQVGDNFEISSSASGGAASVTVSDSAPGSPSEGDLWWKSDDGNLYIYYDGYWVISTDITTGLPAGVVSGSAQITSVITDSYISASAASSGFGSGGGTSDFTQLTNVPSGLVSGSTQITDGSGIVSGSVITTLDGTGVVSGSVLRSLDGTNVVSSSAQVVTLLPDGVFSGSFIGQGATIITSGSGNVIISSSASGDVTFNGNRIISQEKLPAFFTASFNPGTSGSVQDFLNAIFYPNSEPTITTGNQTISEYSASNADIVQLVATDPEGQSLTFGTGSSYTDDLVRVSSSGLMKLNALAESSSFNTSPVGGGHGHLVKVKATDTFNSSVEKDIYIIVTPNEAPVFRETSISGNIITSVTANLNESSANDTLVKRVFFTDTESDTITITTSSIDNNHFDIDVQSTYLDIRQNTSSLDYEQQTTYNFSITASDEHNVAGQDSDSFTILPITVNVTDNLVPVVNSQVVGSINENSSNGASVGSISATDSEGDSISFVTFDLHKLVLDGSTVTSGSYGGTSQLTDPHENPFQMDSSGNVTRKTGVYLNSDLINQYQYRVQVRDNYNATISSASVATINIIDDTPATLTDNWSAGPYIKESEESGATMKTTNYGSAAADYDSNQSGTWASSNSQISINSNGNLLLGFNLSGSVTQSGDTLDSTITFTNTFGTTTTDNLSVVIVANHFPSASFTNQTSNFNSNLATTNTNMVLVSITDTEGDTPYSASLSGTDAGKLNINYTNSNSSSLYIRANENLSAGTITYNLRVTDAYSKSSDYTGRTITIAAADTGTLGGDTTSYIIESGQSGDVIRDASGFGAGNASQLSVSYDPNYGSAAVASYTSSNAAIAVDNSGNLTLGVDISGSVTQSGETISSTITYRDQYDNVGSGTVNVNVFANHFPSASFTQNTSIYNANQMVSGSLVESFTITDTESDVPYSITLSGTDASKIEIVPQNSNTSSVQLKTKQDLAAGTYIYTASISDSYSKTSQYNRSVTIASADTGTLSNNGTYYIIESAQNTDFIVTNSNGRTGTQGQVNIGYSPDYGSQSATNFASSNALIAINSSNGKISAGGNISGSGNTNGDTITSTISWNDQYGNNGSDTISVNIAENQAPNVNTTSTSNLNTNQATGSAQILVLGINDAEGDSIPNSALSFEGYNTTYFTPTINSSLMYLLVNNTSVPAGTYAYTASLQDVHGFSTRKVSNTFTIAQASTGSLGGDTAIYIIESATSGSVFRDQTGFNAGNAAQLSVSYSPNYGSQVVQSFTSSMSSIAVDNSGNLTLNVDISGSVTQSTDTFQTTITYRDQYDNIGSGSVTATVFGNSSPVASFTSSSNYESDNATSGSDAGALVVVDTESNSPFTITLGGTDGGKFDVSGSSSPFEIQPTGSLAAGTYTINITVTDSYSESVTLTGETITVDASANNGKVYLYDVGFNNATYNTALGIQSEDSSTPPVATPYSGIGFVEKLINGDVLGDSSFTYSYGSTQTSNRLAEASGSNVHDVLRTMGTDGDISRSTSVHFAILIPSGSSMTGMPTSTTDSYGGSTAGEYVLEVGVNGSDIDGVNTKQASEINQITLSTAHLGFTKWFIVGSTDQVSSATSINLGLNPSSGSGGV